MHAVPRKRLATKPAADSVGRGEGIGCVRDMMSFAVGDGGYFFRGD